MTYEGAEGPLWRTQSAQFSAHAWGDFGAQEFDAAQQVGLGHAADVHLQDLTVVTEKPVQGDDSIGDLVGAAGEDHAARLQIPVAPSGVMGGRPASAAPAGNMASSCSR